MARPRLRSRRHRHGTRGLSLVELLVGVAVGLFVIAGAATLMSAQLADSRRLAVEAQVQQDLRAAADVITREVRRAGEWGSATDAVWAPGMAVASNPNAQVSVVSSSEIALAWSGASVAGFRLAAGSPGVLQMQDSAGRWQDLTDKTTVNMTGFQVRLLTSATSPALACPAYCPMPAYPSATACWPTLEVRELQMQLSGRSIADPNVTRSLLSNVRLRNDRLVNHNGSGPLCPG